MAHRRTYTLFHNTKTKLLNITTSLVLLASSLSGAMPLLLSGQAVAAGASYATVPFTAASMSSWSQDRSAPSGGYPTGTYQGRDNVLDMKVDNTKASTSGSFYQTEGLQRAIPGSGAIKADLYLDNAWSGKQVRAGLWGVADDSSNQVSAYPIIEFTTTGENNFTGWRVFDGVNGGWTNLTNVPYTLGTWNTLEITFDAINHQFDVNINGTQEITKTADTTTHFGAVILNEYNYATNNPADNYDAYWSNFAYGNFPPASPVNTHFLNDRNASLACGSTTNSIFSNKLQFVWDSGSADSNGYRTKITFPDGQSKWAYTGSRNVWMGNVTQYNFDNGFGEHGNGAYTYEVQAKNAFNLWSDSAAPCTLYYDTQIPVAHFVSAPADGAHVNGTLNIEATGQDNVGLKGLFVDVRTQDGKTWQTGCSGTPVYSADKKTATLDCTINTSNLADGTTYMLRVHAGDNAGYGNVNADAVRYFTIDRTLPTAEITSPTGTVNGSTLTIKGSANDNADFNYYYCYVTLPGSSEVGVRNPDCNTTWHSVTNGTLGSVDISGLADGNYEAHLVAYDKAGNHSDLNYFVPFTLDNSGPVVAITAPTNGKTVSYVQNGTLDIKGTVTDQHADHYYLKISGPNGYTAGPGTVHASNSFTGEKLFSWNLKGLASGNYTIDLEARDSLGNKDGNSTQQIHVTVDNDAPAAPTLVSPVDQAVINGKSVTQSWSDGSSDIDHYVYESYSDAGAKNVRWHQQFSATVTSKTATNVPDKTVYWWRVMAVDKVGNSSAWSELRKITVDNTAPSTPVATPGAGTYVGPQLVSLTSSDANGAPDIYYTTDGSDPDQKSTLYTGAILVSSDTTIKAVAYDSAGNVSNVLTAAYTITQPVNPIGGLGGPGVQTLNAPATTPFRAFAVTAPSASLQNTSTGDGSTGVLGASTTQPNNSGEVKGANTTTSNDKNDASKNAKSSAFLGLGWWWLLILAAVAAVLYAATRRQATGSKDYS